VVRLINVLFFFIFGGILMKIGDVFRIVSELEPAVVTVSDKGNRRVKAEGGRKVLYVGSNGTEVIVVRTDRICEGDFKVVLKPPGRREFAPTHVRLFFDLYLKKISDEQKARKVFLAFERVNKGEDVEKVIAELKGLTFSMELDPVDVTLFYGFLLMAEQDWNYGPQGCRSSNLNPPREFLMRFIRWLAQCDYGDIDRIITTAVRNRPASNRYSTPLDKLWSDTTTILRYL